MLVLLFGPPAVGKMTVGRAMAARSDFRLFHNHMTIEPLSQVFGYGSHEFNVLNAEFRTRVLEEAASGGRDLVFSLVWALDDVEDLQIIRSYVEIFDGDVALVELRAPLDVRLERNRGAERLDAKPSKRDLEWSDQNLRDSETHVLESRVPTVADELLEAHPHLVLDTVERLPDETAETILAWLERLRAR